MNDLFENLSFVDSSIREAVSEISKSDKFVKKILIKLSTLSSSEQKIECLLAAVVALQQREVDVANRLLKYLQSNEQVKKTLGEDFEKLLHP